MRIIIFLLLLVYGNVNGQIINGSPSYRVRTVQAAPSCPNVLVFGTLSNLTENTPGTYTVTSAASDGNAKSSTTISGSADSSYAYFEYQSADGFQFALGWDSLSTLSTSYHTTAKFLVFVFADEYWCNYDQEGAISTGVTAVDGDLVGFHRIGDRIYAKYKRGAGWVQLRLFEGQHSTTINQYISSANDGSTNLKIRNLKYCIY